MINVLVIAIGLALDCFGVSIVMGGNLNRKKLLSVGLLVSGVFGLFHGAMITAGFFIEETFTSFISGIDHWVAFIMLFVVGVRMIYGSSRKHKKIIDSKNINFKLIMSLALATSIDALIVGMGIVYFGVPILLSVMIVGLVTFFLSVTGIFLGVESDGLLKHKAGIVGGFVLIIMGFKILIDHLV